MPEVQIYINGEPASTSSATSLTQSPAVVDGELARSVVAAAERGDKLGFAAAARRFGSLEDAQALVRSRGIVRMADRVTVTRSADVALVGPAVELRSVDAAGEEQAPTMFGHFAVFDEWTEIDSWFEGNFVERIAPGAFRKTFRENRAEMRSLFQHGFDPQIGDKPLGTIGDLREDDTGAYYEVPLLDAAYVRDDILPGLQAELYGASFRFQMMREQFDTEPGVSDHNPKGLPERTLKELRVLEFGPVTFPAYPSATAAVRSAGETDEEQEEEVPAPADGDADPALHPARNGGAGAAGHLAPNARRGATYKLDAREEKPSWALS